VVIDRADPSYGDVEGYRRTVNEIVSNENWQQLYSSHGVIVLRKRAASR
jgi:hypothetical protein